jgi:hypothetical protein
MKCKFFSRRKSMFGDDVIMVQGRVYEESMKKDSEMSKEFQKFSSEERRRIIRWVKKYREGSEHWKTLMKLYLMNSEYAPRIVTHWIEKFSWNIPMKYDV